MEKAVIIGSFPPAEKNVSDALPPELRRAAQRGLSSIPKALLNFHDYEVVTDDNGLMKLRPKETESPREKKERCEKILLVYSGYIAEMYYEKLDRFVKGVDSALLTDEIDRIETQAAQFKSRKYRIYPTDLLETLTDTERTARLATLVVNMVTRALSHGKSAVMLQMKNPPDIEALVAFRNRAFRSFDRIDPVIAKELSWALDRIGMAPLVEHIPAVVSSLETNLRDFDYIDVSESMPAASVVSKMKGLFATPFWYLQFHEDEVRRFAQNIAELKIPEVDLDRMRYIFRHA